MAPVVRVRGARADVVRVAGQRRQGRHHNVTATLILRPAARQASLGGALDRPGDAGFRKEFVLKTRVIACCTKGTVWPQEAGGRRVAVEAVVRTGAASRAGAAAWRPSGRSAARNAQVPRDC